MVNQHTFVVVMIHSMLGTTLTGNALISTTLMKAFPEFQDKMLTDYEVVLAKLVIKGSLLSCILRCLQTPHCAFINYHKESGDCCLFKRFYPTDLNSQNKSGSLFYGIVSEKCPIELGFSASESHKYCSKIFTNRLSWEDAEKACKRHGTRLIVIEDITKQYELAKAIGKHTSAYKAKIWIGLSDTAEQNKYVWVDGTPHREENYFWKDGEPNNAPQNGKTQDCVMLHKDHSHDEWCWLEMYYMCET